MKEVIISGVWIASGVYLVLIGCESYWAYSDPNTVWVGMLPELYSIAHIYIGIKAISVGTRLLFNLLKVKVKLMDFSTLLVVSTIIVLGRELVIYGKLTANSYLIDEMYLGLYGGLIIVTLVRLKKIGLVSDIWNWGSYKCKNTIRFKKNVLKFTSALILLPIILQYNSFNFLH
ncbi:MAG: hypothetical protein WA958_09775 [Tunicatimonas sp.]